MKSVSNHLRHAGLPLAQQRDIFSQMILESPLLTDALHRLHELAGEASDFWLVSGALYNTIWNRLTGRPVLHGIKDLDIIYFDGSDLSWEAEDAVIARGGWRLPRLSASGAGSQSGAGASVVRKTLRTALCAASLCDRIDRTLFDDCPLRGRAAGKRRRSDGGWAAHSRSFRLR